MSGRRLRKSLWLDKSLSSYVELFSSNKWQTSKYLKPTRSQDVDIETADIIEKVVGCSQNCQQFRTSLVRYKATISSEDDLKLDDKLSIELRFINGIPIPHVVNTATRFSAATFLGSNGKSYEQSRECICFALIACWCTMSTGYTRKIKTDQRSVLTSDKRKFLLEKTGIELKWSRIQTQSSLDIRNRLHEPLRQVFKKLRMGYRNVNVNLLLK